MTATGEARVESPQSCGSYSSCAAGRAMRPARGPTSSRSSRPAMASGGSLVAGRYDGTHAMLGASVSAERETSSSCAASGSSTTSSSMNQGTRSVCAGCATAASAPLRSAAPRAAGGRASGRTRGSIAVALVCTPARSVGTRTLRATRARRTGSMARENLPCALPSTRRPGARGGHVHGRGRLGTAPRCFAVLRPTAAFALARDAYVQASEDARGR